MTVLSPAAADIMFRNQYLADQPGTVVFDLDSTLADTTRRQYLLDAQPVDWEKYSLACDTDQPIAGTVKLARLLSPHHLIVILTGRNETARFKTVSWLSKHSVPWDKLVMRQPGDHTPNSQYKVRAIQRLIDEPYKIVLAVEDYPVSARAIRDAYPRIPVLVVNPEYPPDARHANPVPADPAHQAEEG